MINLELAKEFENHRIYYLELVNTQIKLRNLNIYIAFKRGYRQKEIANALGLSESTIKHIIAKQKA